MPHTENSRALEKNHSHTVTDSHLVLQEQRLVHESEQKLCVVCLVENKNMLLMPCKHLCMCSKCAVGLDECPICRTTVEERVSVFM